MPTEDKILLEQDKSFVSFLWLLSIVTLYYLYAGAIFFRIIPFGKGIFGMLMMASEILMIVMATKTYREYYTNLNPFIRVVIILTIIYNFGHIVYATFWEGNVAYLSLFGNPYYQPSFMLPVALLMGLKPERFFQLHKCIWYFVLMMIPIYLILRGMNVFGGTGLLFLLAFARYLPRKKKIVLFLVATLYVIYCYYDDARVPILRVIMGGAIMVFSYTSIYKSRFVKSIIFITIIALPLYYLSLYLTSGYSIFEQSTTSSYVSDMGAEHSGDTRTFLYEEVFEDLTSNDAVVLGKGINGTYYSSYFDNKYSIEKENRFFVEVGLLFFILKGGLIQAVAYLLILIAAIYVCLVRTRSKFVSLIGFVLLSRYVLFFVEDLPRYDLYNITMWMYMGLALSVANMDLDDVWFEEKFDAIFSI